MVTALLVGFPFNAVTVRSVVEYGAASDGASDATEAFNRAIAEAGATGGTVSVPPGRFRIEGSVKLGTGVTLEGSWTGPHHGAWRQGSTLLVTGGRGEENGPAAIEMVQSSTVRGLTIVYPEQKLEDLAPYPWTIRGTGMHCTVENVTLVNSFNGIAMGPGSNELHLIRNVFGCVLRRGLLIDGCTDIGRVENVHFNPHYWVRAEYPGTSGIWHVNLPDGGEEVRHPQWYMERNLEGFIFGRTDWEYVLNTFVFGANVGYRFVETSRGAPNGNFLGIGADWCRTCVQADATQPMGILITNGEFVGNRECEAAVVVKGGVLSLCNSNFWGFQHRNVSVKGGLANLTACIFRDWGPVPEGPAAVEAEAGSLTVQGSSFLRDREHIRIGAGVATAAVFGNTFAASPRIRNESDGDVKIDLNVAPVPPNDRNTRPRRDASRPKDGGSP